MADTAQSSGEDQWVPTAQSDEKSVQEWVDVDRSPQEAAEQSDDMDESERCSAWFGHVTTTEGFRPIRWGVMYTHRVPMQVLLCRLHGKSDRQTEARAEHRCTHKRTWTPWFFPRTFSKPCFELPPP